MRIADRDDELADPQRLGVADERRALYLAFASEDAKEGLTAFVDKRKPEFRGR